MVKIKVLPPEKSDNEEEIKKSKEEQEILKKKLIDDYINTLDSFELEALEIAKKNLGTSFDLENSIGFLEYKEKINNS